MHKLIKSFFLAALFSILIGCSEETIYKVGLHGTLIGYVYTSGSIDFPLEGVSVTIEGTDPLVTTYTDSKGKFSVPDLETGTYHIVFTKSGFGTNKVLGYAFIGGQSNSLVTTVLYSLPNIEIRQTTAQIKKEYYYDYYTLEGTILTDNPETNEYGLFRYYLSQSPTVSISDYDVTDMLGYYYSTSNSFKKNFDTKRFPPGSTVYLLIYPCTEQFSHYTDLNTGNKIYTSIGQSHSEVIKLVVPL